MRGEVLGCDDVADLLPGLIEGSDGTDPQVAAHAQTCLRCQAELAQYRRLLRVLRQLRAQGLEPPPGLVGEILAHLEWAAERGALRSALAGRRMAYLTGLAVAAGAAGAAGAVVIFANRGRSSAKLPAHGKLPLAS